MRIMLLAAVWLALSAAAPAPKDGLRFVDLTRTFDRVAMTTRKLGDKARVAAFEKRMSPLASGFYARDRQPNDYDKRVLAALKAYPEQRQAILSVSREFQNVFGPAKASFEKQFGPVTSPQPVYLLHSLGERAGGTRELKGKSTLIFGADVIAKIHAGQDVTPFFHHELFHVIHQPRMSECDGVWCSLWEEGLATYVAAQLNPRAGDAALLLDQPAPIRPAVDANRRAAICAVVPLLGSQKQEDYAALFYGRSHLPGFPARMGYYIGYLVAADLGKTRSL